MTIEETSEVFGGSHDGYINNGQPFMDEVGDWHFSYGDLVPSENAEGFDMAHHEQQEFPVMNLTDVSYKENNNRFGINSLLKNNAEEQAMTGLQIAPGQLPDPPQEEICFGMVC